MEEKTDTIDIYVQTKKTAVQCRQLLGQRSMILTHYVLCSTTLMSKRNNYIYIYIKKAEILMFNLLSGMLLFEDSSVRNRISK